MTYADLIARYPALKDADRETLACFAYEAGARDGLQEGLELWKKNLEEMKEKHGA